MNSFCAERTTKWNDGINRAYKVAKAIYRMKLMVVACVTRMYAQPYDGICLSVNVLQKRPPAGSWG